MKKILKTLVLAALILVSLFGSAAFSECSHWRICDVDYCWECNEPYTGSNIYHINPRWEIDDNYHWGYCPDCGATLDKEKHQRYCVADEKYCFICYQPYTGNNIRHENFITDGGESYCSACGSPSDTLDSAGNCKHAYSPDNNEKGDLIIYCVFCGWRTDIENESGNSNTSDTSGTCKHTSGPYFVYADEENHWVFCLECGATIIEGAHSSIRWGDGWCEICREYLESTITSNNGGKNYRTDYLYKNSAPLFETVEFGTFEQDNDLSNGEEVIQWYILYSDSEKALLLSRFALINMSFNKKWVDINWDYSSIREWLNNDFYYSSFTNDERNAFLTSGGSSSWYGGYGEITIEDNVFLLSLDEVNYYIDNAMRRQVIATPYAKANGIQVKDGYSWWWLRSMGDSNKIAQFIFENGSISTIGRDVSSYAGGIRPAIWVDASVIQ